MSTVTADGQAPPPKEPPKWYSYRLVLPYRIWPIPYRHVRHAPPRRWWRPVSISAVRATWIDGSVLAMPCWNVWCYTWVGVWCFGWYPHRDGWTWVLWRRG